MKYTASEDNTLMMLKEKHTHNRRPAWKEITSEMNQVMGYKYTKAMLRNRDQRMRFGKISKKRNRCKICGQFKRGHTCYPFTKVKLRMKGNEPSLSCYSFTKKMKATEISQDNKPPSCYPFTKVKLKMKDTEITQDNEPPLSCEPLFPTGCNTNCCHLAEDDPLSDPLFNEYLIILEQMY